MADAKRRHLRSRNVMRSIRCAVQNKGITLSAAFDTMHHDKLIGRLESDLGITDNALAWFKSYLSDRFQRVSVDGSLRSVSFKTRCSSRFMFWPLAFHYLYAKSVSDLLTPPPTSPLLCRRYTVVCII